MTKSQFNHFLLQTGYLWAGKLKLTEKMKLEKKESPFLSENNVILDKNEKRPWKIIIADDSRSIHDLTIMVLRNYRFENAPLQFLSAYSGESAQELVKENPDAALILLDVIMETERAGLDTVKYIRNTLKNNIIQIILRTGQPGKVPEAEVITDYEINTYHSKTDLAAQKLVTVVTSSLRAFKLNRTLQHLNKTLKLEIKDRQKTERALRKSEKRYRNLVESLDESYFFYQINKAGRMSYSSPSVKGILGYEAKEFNTKFIDYLTDSVINEKAKSNYYHSRKEDYHLQFELEVYHKLGHIRNLEILQVFIYDDAGEITGIDGIAHDITERKISEREREKLNQELIKTSRLAGMAEISTGLLHNVGNVLNSVNVSSQLLAEKVNQSKFDNLLRALELINTNRHRLDQFFSKDEKGKMLPTYLINLCDYLTEEKVEQDRLVDNILKNIDHIKQLIASQQVFAKQTNIAGGTDVPKLIEEALLMSNIENKDGIQIIRKYGVTPEIIIDKHKIIQILLNLFKNAYDAVKEAINDNNYISIKTEKRGEDKIAITISDNGVGIEPCNIKSLFSHGFTTKMKGHGFGLHSAALAANEINGSLKVQSGGPGKGASFCLEFLITKEI